MAKERNLCRAVAMAADQPTLLQRAIDAYKKDGDLSATEQELLWDAEEYLKDIQALESNNRGLLDELYNLSGLDICEIGYDD